MEVKLRADHEYHVVELRRGAMPDEVEDWLTRSLGPGDGTRWFCWHSKLHFTNKQDHMMFLLRWYSE